MKIVLFFIGTRPEAIKLAPVILRMKSRPNQFKVIVCATAQHREMLDQVLQLFEISPDIDLDLMMPNQSLPSFTARSLLTVTDVIKKVEPQIVLVQGDVTTVGGDVAPEKLIQQCGFKYLLSPLITHFVSEISPPRHLISARISAEVTRI